MADARAALQQRVEYNREQRAREAQYHDSYQKAGKEYAAAPSPIPMDFWCEECQADVKTIGYKTIRTGLNLVTGQNYISEPFFAYYIGLCPKRHRVRRYITDKHRDPYFMQSLSLQRQRAELADDLVQPGDPRFRILYPKQWRAMEEAREAQELAAKQP